MIRIFSGRLRPRFLAKDHCRNGWTGMHPSLQKAFILRDGLVNEWPMHWQIRHKINDTHHVHKLLFALFPKLIKFIWTDINQGSDMAMIRAEMGDKHKVNPGCKSFMKSSAAEQQQVSFAQVRKTKFDLRWSIHHDRSNWNIAYQLSECVPTLSLHISYTRQTQNICCPI